MAELKAVRTNFVEKVSMPVIEQLLDNLLDDGVLNIGEQEAIVEARSNRTRCARLLIDTVWRKGDESSWKMITHLNERDSMLAKELGLPAFSPQAASELECQWSSSLIPCKKTFWNSKKNDPKIYPVTKESIQSRVALLINNTKFEYVSTRHGSEVDEEKMERLLRALGYEVIKYTNRTGEEMEKAICEFSKHPKLKDTDSVFVVIMSYGQMGSVFGVRHEGDLFPIDRIFSQLGAGNCQALMDKPKIIIIQSCRGDHGHGEGYSTHISDDAKALWSSVPVAEHDGGAMNVGYQHVNKEKHFIAFHACSPGTMSFRNIKTGALFIEYLVDAVNTSACVEDIEELFRMVKRRFETLTSRARNQMPTVERCTLTRRFYLFPGISLN
ncbi:caspase-1-A-like isoform X2 [Stigmatopora argus]